MANYCCACRTSYFRVDDEEKYTKLFNSLDGEDIIDNFTKKDENGNVWHAFGSYGPIGPRSDGDDEDGWPTMDDFWETLSKIIHKGDACVYMEAGHEKLRYVVGDLVVVTKGYVDYRSLTTTAKQVMKARGINPDDVEMDY